MSTVLALHHISKTYENNTTFGLREISLNIPKGEIFCLTGENGAGKSTLLEMIAGLREPDSGKIFFYTEELKGPSNQLIPGHPRIKILRQNSTLYPNISIYENIRYELKHYPLSLAEKKISALIKMFQLTDVQHKKPSEVSGGQKQKAATACAMANDPEVVIFDEPFIHTDLVSRRNISKEIFKVLRALKTTLVFSTHDPYEALTNADTIAILHRGQVIQIGTPENIYRYPSSLHAARLFGTCSIVPDIWISKKQSKGMLACIRPENMQVCAMENADFSCTVIESRFTGPFYEVVVKSEEGLLLTLLSAQLIKLHDTIFVRVDKSMVHLFPAEESGAGTLFSR
jgi:ABC-type Fe3+/spermidine/putrescine transport system ATPase subunit